MTRSGTAARKIAVAVLAAGAVLLLSALLLFCRSRSEDRRAGRQAGALLKEIEVAIAEASAAQSLRPAEAGLAAGSPHSTVQAASADADDPHSGEAGSAAPLLDNTAYAGFLEIPALALTLPVLSDWDYARLQIAPCRQFGSSATDDLVIAAHNYQSHFGRLKELSAGELLSFTDMAGLCSTYAVQDVRTLLPTEVSAVQDSGCDLVLYTCTYGGKSRVAVFCSRVSDAL